MQITPPAMTNPTPKQDGQTLSMTIDEILGELQLEACNHAIGSPTAKTIPAARVEAKQAIEAYCAERERLAELRAFRRLQTQHLPRGGYYKVDYMWIDREIKKLQKESGSQEAK